MSDFLINTKAITIFFINESKKGFDIVKKEVENVYFQDTTTRILNINNQDTSFSAICIIPKNNMTDEINRLFKTSDSSYICNYHIDLNLNYHNIIENKDIKRIDKMDDLLDSPIPFLKILVGV